jgi:hypothetical protein
MTRLVPAALLVVPATSRRLLLRSYVSAAEAATLLAC